MIHESTVWTELYGSDREMRIQYEPDPTDGYPHISRVELLHVRSDFYDARGDAKPRKTTVVVEITELLDDAQLRALEAEIIRNSIQELAA